MATIAPLSSCSGNARSDGQHLKLRGNSGAVAKLRGHRELLIRAKLLLRIRHQIQRLRLVWLLGKHAPDSVSGRALGWETSGAANHGSQLDRPHELTKARAGGSGYALVDERAANIVCSCHQTRL